MTGSLALDAEGRFIALRHEWVCDQGAYPVATGPLISTLNPAMMCSGCYRVPSVYGWHRLALTNTVPITAYRGAGRPDMAYMVERLVDEAARQTFALRSMLSQGAASQVAAETVIRKGRVLASAALEADEADIAYASGRFRVDGTDVSLGLFELAERHPGALDTIEALPAGRAYPSGAHVVEVKIDPETGVVVLQNYVAVDDCGAVLNPTLLHGHILDGMMQGVGSRCSSALLSPAHRHALRAHPDGARRDPARHGRPRHRSPPAVDGGAQAIF